MKITLLPILLTALAVQAASAISVTSFTANSTGPGSPVITFDGFLDGAQAGLSIATGVTLDYDTAVIVQNLNNASGANPFPISEGDYLSITAQGTATLAFTNDQNSIGFMWGSIDAYNSVEFLLNNTQVGLFSGTDVVTAPVNADGAQFADGSAYVEFGNGSFDQVVFTSSDNSFEIDNISFVVPASGSTIIFLGLGLLGLGAASRRFKK